MSSFCKSYSHFCSKNINVFGNTLATICNKFVINGLVKLMLLWKTGPWSIFHGLMTLKPFCQLVRTWRILCHWGVQLILAYSWARPAILVAGKGRGGMFLFLLFLHFHSCSSFFRVPLFHLLYYLFHLFSPFLWGRHKMTHKGWRVVKPQHNQLWSLAFSFMFWINYTCTFSHQTW